MSKQASVQDRTTKRYIKLIQYKSVKMILTLLFLFRRFL